VEGDVFRVLTVHPQFGAGCMSIPRASKVAGTDVEDDYCDKGAGELYRWEPVSVPTAGYRIHPVHTDLCLGFPPGSPIGTTTLRQLPWAVTIDQVFL